LTKIEELSKIAVKEIRDVWWFTRPLSAIWNKLNPLRNKPTVQHWGIIVSDIDKETAETVLGHKKKLKKKTGRAMGVIHELNRVGKESAYRVYNWMSNTIQGKFQFIGKTKLKDNEILSKGKSPPTL
jgi:hypothetical protein